MRPTTLNTSSHTSSHTSLKLALALVLALLLLLGSAPLRAPVAHASGGTWQQFTFNGAAGSRPYFVYTPANYAGATVPLFVMLHGCTQTPADFAAGTQMDALADQYGFLVAYPQQTSTYNQTECWNWFLSAHQSRGSGEPAIIAGIVGAVEGNAAWKVDTSRVYVAGMSAGAAMAVIMGATYPDIFAAIGVHSGLEYGAATTQSGGTTALSQGGPNPTQQGQAAYNAMGAAARVVPTIVFHGASDFTVYPLNGDQVVQQWMQTDHLASNNAYNASFNSPSSTTNGQVSGGRAYTTTTWNDASGAEIQEYWKVTGMGHAWSGGSNSGSFTDPQGPSASQAMYSFFAAHPQGPTVSASPAGGAYSGSVTVTLTANPSSATIRYTTDGTTPTGSSPQYTAPLVLSQTTTLKFYATDANGHASAIQTQTYTISNPGPVITASPAGGTYGGPVSVTLGSNEPSTTIYYTTDGTTPTTGSPQYAGALQFAQTTTLRYFGVDANNHASPAQAQTYTITAIQVTASPPGGTYSGPQSVSLSLNMPGTINYTTDGSTPTTGSPRYAGPINVATTETLKFLGVDQLGHAGAVQSAAYTITAPPPISTLTLNSLAAEDGYVYQFSSDGVPNSAIQYCEIGSSGLNHGEVGVVSFDTSRIPAGATIVSVTLTLYRYDAFPFNNDLGPLTADIAPASGFNGRYALEQADYGAAAALTNIGNFTAVPTAQNQAITDAVAQGALPSINRAGHTQFRIHFQKATNNDYMLDVLHVYSGDSGGAYVPTLTVKYQ